MIEYIHNEEKQIDNITYIWFIGNCLSTDFKPVDKVYDGSRLFEKDTLKQFVYSYPKKKWEETVAGGGTCNTLVVNAIVDETNGTITLDKTFAEIIESGSVVINNDYSEGSSFKGRICCQYSGFMMDNDSGEYNISVYAMVLEDAGDTYGKLRPYTFIASSMDDYPIFGSNNGPDNGTVIPNPINPSIPSA